MFIGATIENKSKYIVILVRTLTMNLSLLSAALNPLIQVFVEKDLFVAVSKLLGKTADFSWQREMKNVVNVRKNKISTIDH